jgi:hypothetical protein
MVALFTMWSLGKAREGLSTGHFSHFFQPQATVYAPRFIRGYPRIDRIRIRRIEYTQSANPHPKSGNQSIGWSDGIRSGRSPTYMYQSTTGTLWYGDSLGHLHDSIVKEVLEWLLRGIAVLKVVRAGQIARQPTNGSMGSGSCGAAAFNFIERRCIPGISSWSASNSDQARYSMLRDLINYHLTAKDTTGVSHRYNLLSTILDVALF